jgi:hypothetical protein
MEVEDVQGNADHEEFGGPPPPPQSLHDLVIAKSKSQQFQLRSTGSLIATDCNAHGGSTNATLFLTMPIRALGLCCCSCAQHMANCCRGSLLGAPCTN